MMDVRERLIKICDTDFGYVDEVPAEKFADYLLANDVTLVKHGKWRHVKGLNSKCSECNRYFPVTEFSTRPFDINYCPNCGARMDGDGS